jgi:hypothetical protein
MRTTPPLEFNVTMPLKEFERLHGPLDMARSYTWQACGEGRIVTMTGCRPRLENGVVTFTSDDCASITEEPFGAL